MHLEIYMMYIFITIAHLDQDIRIHLKIYVLHKCEIYSSTIHTNMQTSTDVINISRDAITAHLEIYSSTIYLKIHVS